MTPLHSLIQLLKKYFILIIACVVIGNVLHWLNKRGPASYYDLQIETKATSFYYDETRKAFNAAGDSLKKSLTADEKKKLIGLSLDSYRHDDRYTIQLHIKLSDTINLAAISKRINIILQKDSLLRKEYYDKQEYYESLGREYAAQINRITNLPPESVTVEIKNDLLALKSQQYELKYNPVAYPSPTRINEKIAFVQTNMSVKGYVLATIMFFIIGLVIAIIIDLLKNKAPAQ